MSIKDRIEHYSSEMPFWSIAVRVFWIATQITLILWFGQKGYLFFYQGF